MHRFSLEVGREGALAIGAVLESLVAVCRESTRKHGDVAEHALQRLVQDVGHLVLHSHEICEIHIALPREKTAGRMAHLKVLRRRERTCQEERAALAGVDADLSTRATDSRMLVEA